MNEILEFLPRQLVQDDRAVFANSVCDLLAKSSPYNIYGSLDLIRDIRDHFQENVRNVYQLVDSQIPLFAYYDLMQVDEDNYGWTKEQYDQNLSIAKKAAIEYHNWE